MSQRPVPEMCTGCARDRRTTCEVIVEPGFMYQNRGSCFARVNAARAREIEKEIAFMIGKRYPKKRRTAQSVKDAQERRI